MPRHRWLLAALAAILAVGSVHAGDAAQCYVAPLIGPSWSSLTLDGSDASVDRNLLTAGGAAGVAIDRPAGRARLEFEARYRDGYTLADAAPGIAARVETSDNWSTLVNVWRDVFVTDQTGIYAGGGIGAGGYGIAMNIDATILRLDGADRTSDFAWQIGGGVFHDLSDRVTLDLGYRFYSVADGMLPLTATFGGTPVGTTSVINSFAASEMLLSIRIMEPFRGWR